MAGTGSVSRSKRRRSPSRRLSHQYFLALRLKRGELTAFIDRFQFYDRARGAFAVVMTGETAKYGNIILKKGVTPT